MQNNIPKTFLQALKAAPAPCGVNAAVVRETACFSCKRSPLCVLGCVHQRAAHMNTHTIITRGAVSQRMRILTQSDLDELERIAAEGRLVPTGPVDKYGYAATYTLIGRGLGGALKKRPKPTSGKMTKKKKNATPKPKVKVVVKHEKAQRAARSTDTVAHGAAKRIDALRSKFSLKYGTFSIPTVPGSTIVRGRWNASEFAAIAGFQQGPGNQFTSAVLTHSSAALLAADVRLDLRGVPALAGGSLALIFSEESLSNLSADQLVAYVDMRLKVSPPLVHIIPLGSDEIRKKHSYPATYREGPLALHPPEGSNLDAVSAGFFTLILYQPMHYAPIAGAPGTTDNSLSAVSVMDAGIISVQGEVMLFGKKLPSEMQSLRTVKVTVAPQTTYGAPVTEPNGPLAVGPLFVPVPPQVADLLTKSPRALRIRAYRGKASGVDQYDLTDVILTVVKVGATAIGPFFGPTGLAVAAIVEGGVWLVERFRAGMTSADIHTRSTQVTQEHVKEQAVPRSSVFNSSSFVQLADSSLSPNANAALPLRLRQEVTQMLADFNRQGSLWQAVATTFSSLAEQLLLPDVIEHTASGANSPHPSLMDLTFAVDDVSGGLVSPSNSMESIDAAFPMGTYISSQSESFPSGSIGDPAGGEDFTHFAYYAQSRCLVPCRKPDGDVVPDLSSPQQIRDSLIRQGYDVRPILPVTYTNVDLPMVANYAVSMRGYLPIEGHTTNESLWPSNSTPAAPPAIVAGYLDLDLGNYTMHPFLGFHHTFLLWERATGANRCCMLSSAPFPFSSFEPFLVGTVSSALNDGNNYTECCLNMNVLQDVIILRCNPTPSMNIDEWSAVAAPRAASSSSYESLKDLPSSRLPTCSDPKCMHCA